MGGLDTMVVGMDTDVVVGVEAVFGMETGLYVEELDEISVETVVNVDWADVPG